MESHTNDPDSHSAFMRGNCYLRRAPLWEEVCTPWKDGVIKGQQGARPPNSSGQDGLQVKSRQTPAHPTPTISLKHVQKEKDRGRDTGAILPSLFKGKFVWLFWPNLKDAFPQACSQSKIQTPSGVFQTQQNWSQFQVAAPPHHHHFASSRLLGSFLFLEDILPKPLHPCTASPSKRPLTQWPLHRHTLLSLGLLRLQRSMWTLQLSLHWQPSLLEVSLFAACFPISSLRTRSQQRAALVLFII